MTAFEDPVAAGAEPDARALTATENAELCRGCVKCCTYITVEIDPPRAAWEYDQWLWALHHEHVNLYLEKPERWLLHFETRCRQLKPDGRCAIHGRHPVLCREYDPRYCERRLPLADVAAWFHTAEELEAWIRTRRPRHWERLVAYRHARETPVEAMGLSPGFVPVQSLLAGSALPPSAAPRRRPNATASARSVRAPRAE